MKKKIFKMRGIILIILLGVFALAIGIIYQSKKNSGVPTVVLYDGPSTLEDASEEDIVAAAESERDIKLKHCTDTSIKVNGQECYVYDTNVNLSRTWNADFLPKLSRTPITYFDFEGKVEIEVSVPQIELEKVTISPLSYGIEPEIDAENHTVTFTVTEPDMYTVLFNESPERAVHIFANPLEEEIPDFEDENVIYIGPGEWDMGTIALEDGQTLYIAGGAVVYGRVMAEGVNDIKIMGRGIIDGSKFPGWKAQAPFVSLEINACNNVNVKDIIILNSNCWVCQGYETENMVIEGLKIISCRPNGDGISLQSCRNTKVKNGFVRSWDDSLVVKNYYRNSNNISFTNMQLWTDFAQSMEIGYETNKGKMENSAITDIVFEDICVLHNYHKPVISVHNGDDAVVSDIVFRNIIVEDAQMGSGDGDVMPYLIDLNIAQSGSWSSTKSRGTIENVKIDNVNVISGKFCPSRISGYDEEHKVSNITISNLTILGEKIKSVEEGKFEVNTETTENIIFK